MDRDILSVGSLLAELLLYVVATVAPFIVIETIWN